MARRYHKGGIMGLLGKIFSAKPDYPALDASNPAAKYLDAVRSPLQKLADQTSDPLEIVPAEDDVYIFLGKPPKKFGIAWIEGGKKIVNFKSLVEEKGLPPDKLQKLSEDLRQTYIAHQDKPRFVTQINDRDVVVIPSTSLKDKLKDVVKKMVG
jgi:hypothetical protein